MQIMSLIPEKAVSPKEKGQEEYQKKGKNCSELWEKAFPEKHGYTSVSPSAGVFRSTMYRGRFLVSS